MRYFGETEMETASGEHFDLLEPRAYDGMLSDIAHSLVQEVRHG